MKILHTSDWHLGHKFYRYERKDEQIYFLRQIAAIVKQQQPDVMVISGDIFHTGAPAVEIQTLFVDELLHIKNQCERMSIIVTAGNHDSYSRLEIDKNLWKTLQIHIIGNVSDNLEDHIIKIDDKGYVAAVPFCTERNFPAIDNDETDNRQNHFFKKLLNTVNEQNTQQLPVVLMAHLSIFGSNISAEKVEIDSNGKTKYVGGLEYTAIGDLGKGYDYLALGHIHHPQFVGGDKRVRYCGTPIACSFNEEYPHSVSLVELEAHNAEPTCTEIPIHELRPVMTLPNNAAGVSIDEAIQVLSEHLNDEAYIRLNVNIPQGANLTEYSIRIQERLNVAAPKCRFCAINPIRSDTTEQLQEIANYSIDEIQEMNTDAILNMMDSFSLLNEDQTQKLKEIIEEVNNSNNQ